MGRGHPENSTASQSDEYESDTVDHEEFPTTTTTTQSNEDDIKDTRYTEPSEETSGGTKNEGSVHPTLNAFRIADKKYKMTRTSTWQRKIHPTDYRDVIDLRNHSNNTEENNSKIIKVAQMKEDESYEFLVQPTFNKTWQFPVADASEIEAKRLEVEKPEPSPTFPQYTKDEIAALDPEDRAAYWKQRKQFSQSQRRAHLQKKVDPYHPDTTNLCSGNNSEIFAISSYPGFYVISRALSYRSQLFWALRCFILYPEYTNLTYLKGSQREEDRDLFLKSCVEYKRWSESQKNDDSKNTLPAAIKPAQGNTTAKPRPQVEFPLESSIPASFKAFQALRWSSLGYVYDWTKREYHEKFTLPFPPALASLARLTLYPLQKNSFIVPPTSPKLATDWNQWFRAEAGIINYYPLSSSMGAHIDDAEPAVEHPIVSFSIGCSAVFLVGSASRADPPVAVFLRSGDALIQEGPSRLSFHAVPRIVEHSSPQEALVLASKDILKFHQGVFPCKSSETTSASVETKDGCPIHSILPPRNPGSYEVHPSCSSLPSPPVVDVLERGSTFDSDAEMQKILTDIHPYLQKYDLSLLDVLSFVILVLGESRLNFNVRQVIDEHHGKPSEIRDKRPISAVLDGLHTDNQPRAKEKSKQL